MFVYVYFQSLQAFSTALQSGQLGPIMSHFQLPENAVQAFNRGGIEPEE